MYISGVPSRFRKNFRIHPRLLCIASSSFLGFFVSRVLITFRAQQLFLTYFISQNFPEPKSFPNICFLLSPSSCHETQIHLSIIYISCLQINHSLSITSYNFTIWSIRGHDLQPFRQPSTHHSTWGLPMAQHPAVRTRRLARPRPSAARSVMGCRGLGPLAGPVGSSAQLHRLEDWCSLVTQFLHSRNGW